MRMLLLIVPIIVVLSAGPVPAQDTAVAEQVAQRTVRDYAVPHFGAFAHLAMDQEALIGALCMRPSGGHLEHVRGTFRRLVGRYARVAFLRFGPLADDNSNERLFLWPDPRGIALRQVQALLADQPEDALNWRTLQQKSVALQGLAALEFALFGTGSDDLAAGEEQSYRCRYAHAVAGAIRAVAQQAYLGWNAPDGIARRLISPGFADPDYRSTREVLEEVVGAMTHGIEGIRDTQLLPFVGRDGEAPKPRSAPLWRSNSTVVLAVGGLEGIIGLLRASRITEAASENGRFIAEAIDFEAGNIARAEAVVTGTVEQAVNDPRQMQGLRYLVILTQSLQDLIGTQLSAGLGLSVGFSSLDGD